MERQVGLVREQFFTLRLAAKDFAELNEILREKCLERARIRRHSTQLDKLVMEVFAEERRHLLAVPRPFDGYGADEARVSRTFLVRYDRNHYSVPGNWDKPLGLPAEFDGKPLSRDALVWVKSVDMK